MVQRLIILLVTFTCATLWAQQDSQGPAWSEIAVHTGPYLPDHVEGVTELLPSWGMLYAFGEGDFGYEFSWMNANAKATQYNNASIAMRLEIPIADLFGLFMAGVDAHYYQGPEDQTFRFSPGAHVAAGVSGHIFRKAWGRALMKFNLNPGTALYFGFGLAIRWGDEEKK